jgi:hypothetical protein
MFRHFRCVSLILVLSGICYAQSVASASAIGRWRQAFPATTSALHLIYCKIEVACGRAP